MTTPRKTRVAVVFGGRSTEHAISCVSAGSILAALDPDEYEVVPVGITRDGAWVLTGGDPAQLSITDRQLPEITAAAGSAVVLPADPTSAGLMVLDPADGVSALAGVDVVFPALHGAYGEDGTIQGMLEMAGIPYVGANVFASAAAMDKEFTKKLAAAEGIPVGPYAVLRAGVSLSEADKERLGLPVFVKPSRAGSSYGITKVTDWADLDAAVATARAIDPKVLVEAAIVGREIECGVLEGEAGGAPEASLLAEIQVVRPRLLRLRGQVPRRGSRVRHPGRPAGRGDPPGPGVRLPHLHRAGLRRPGPGRLLRHRRTTRSTSTRSTRCRASRRRRCSRGCGRRPAWSTRSWSTG